jgi:uncharacterized protein
VNVLIAGATGFIGTALVPELRARGHRVQRLVRGRASTDDATIWNPGAAALDPAALSDTDVVINLAGENVAAGRWTSERRERIRRSRIDATRTLVEAIARAKPRPRVLLNASAVGYYGDRGDEVLTETSPKGTGFLADVCGAWEAEAAAATRVDVRTVMLRFGIVLDAEGGALAKMLPVFRLGLGGRLATGQQWMSWISRADAVGAIVHALESPHLNGPLNVVAPEPLTNAVFTAILGRVLRRPVVMPVPRLALRALYGEMADGALLASTQAIPARLNGNGYRFQHPTLECALQVTLRGMRQSP